MLVGGMQGYYSLHSPINHQLTTNCVLYDILFPVASVTNAKNHMYQIEMVSTP